MQKAHKSTINNNKLLQKLLKTTKLIVVIIYIFCYNLHARKY